jgi:hypothetical protein
MEDSPNALKWSQLWYHPYWHRAEGSGQTKARTS